MKIGILGAYYTKIGELWERSISDLLFESQISALDNAGIKISDVDEIFTGNMCAGLLSNQCNLGSMAAGVLGCSKPSMVVEGACASGGLALRAGILAIESGAAKIVLVNGVEISGFDEGDDVDGSIKGDYGPTGIRPMCDAKFRQYGFNLPGSLFIKLPGR